jgi:hypothetical protein
VVLTYVFYEPKGAPAFVGSRSRKDMARAGYGVNSFKVSCLLKVEVVCCHVSLMISYTILKDGSDGQRVRVRFRDSNFISNRHV